MFVCLSCDELFNEPYEKEENLAGRGERPYKERYSCCPYCGSAEIEETTTCEYCGQIIPISQREPVTDNKGHVRWICPECAILLDTEEDIDFDE